MRMRRSWWAGMVLVVAVVGAACGGGQDDGAGVATTPPDPAAETDAPAPAEQDVVAIDDQDLLSDELLEQVTGTLNDRTQSGEAFIEGMLDVRELDTVSMIQNDGRLRDKRRSAYFEPAVLVGSPGQEVTLVVQNRGGLAHTFTIDEQDTDIWILPGDEGEGDTIRITATFPAAPGDDPIIYYCKPHDGGGMLGALVVAEA